MQKDIEIKPRCIGCRRLVDRPSEVEPTLFRAGIFVHNRDSCLGKAETNLSKLRWVAA